MVAVARQYVRYLLRGLIGAIVVGLAFCAYVYFSNAQVLDRSYAVERVSLRVEASSEAVVRGKALADITGCTDCHRPDLRGGVFIDEGWLHGRYYASNLTLTAQRYSDEELVRIIRLGVLPDGRGVVAMPAFGFVRLTDMEITDIIAFVRSLPVGGPEQPAHFIGPLDQWDLWRGRKFKPAVTYVADERRKDPVDAGPEHATAQHLARIVCAECHGGDLKGNGWDSGAPDLVVVGSYGVPELTRLLRTGIGLDGKEHGLMSTVAKDRLRHLSDQQITDLHAYLVRRAQLKL